MVTNHIQVGIEVSDSGTPSLSSQSSITVNILDINDNLPEFEVIGRRMCIQIIS